MPKRFSQTFLLAKAKANSKSFFVLNSSIRYISDYYGEEDVDLEQAEAEDEVVEAEVAEEEDRLVAEAGAAQDWAENAYEEEAEAQEEAAQESADTWAATAETEEGGATWGEAAVITSPEVAPEPAEEEAEEEAAEEDLDANEQVAKWQQACIRSEFSHLCASLFGFLEGHRNV